LDSHDEIFFLHQNWTREALNITCKHQLIRDWQAIVLVFRQGQPGIPRTFLALRSALPSGRVPAGIALVIAVGGAVGVWGLRASGAILRLGTEDQPRRSKAPHSAITIDGKTHEHDVVIRLSGEVVKRKKKLSKKYYGTSHVLSKDEAKFVFERGCEQLIVGSGQVGNVHLSSEAEAYFAKKGCKVLLQPTPEAIHAFNNSHAKKIGLFHVTC
jgi:hypothetical protein